MDHICYLCFVFVICSCLFIAALWSPAGKGLTSWLPCVWCFIVLFVTFPCGAERLIHFTLKAFLAKFRHAFARVFFSRNLTWMKFPEKKLAHSFLIVDIPLQNNLELSKKGFRVWLAQAANIHESSRWSDPLNLWRKGHHIQFDSKKFSISTLHTQSQILYLERKAGTLWPDCGNKSECSLFQYTMSSILQCPVFSVTIELIFTPPQGK